MAITQLRAVARGGAAPAHELAATSGNRIDVLENASEFIPRLVDDIAGAERQVNLSMYAMHHGPADGITDHVTRALRERASSGVPVTVQLDAIGSKLLRGRSAMVDALRADGVDVRVKRFTPLRAGLDDARFATDHRKLIEIDGRVSYQGGVNIVDDWTRWHDVMARVEGPAAAQAGALLAGRWRDVGGDVAATRIAVLESALRTPVEDAGAMVRQLGNGNRANRELTHAHEAMINDARTSLRIVNPYLADETSMQAIVGAARRGVDVELLLPPRAHQLADVLTEPLRRAWGARVHEAGGTVVQLPGFSHAKTTIADDQVLIGSLNLDALSNRRNYEAGIITDDPATHARLAGIFDALRAGAAALDDDTARGWLRLARVRDALGLQY